MRLFTALLYIAIVPSIPCLGEDPLRAAKGMRQEVEIDKDHYELKYRYDPDGEYLKPAEQCVLRAKAAADAWEEFKDSGQPLPVIARSPFGGGETSKTYWPRGVEAELLRNVIEPLVEQDLKPVLPDLPAEKTKDDETSEDVDEADEDKPLKPWPKLGFSDDYPFVLMVGMHHEPIPHKSTRRTAEGEVVYRRSSRMTAWAILFHSKTATAFWAATATAKIGYRSVADPTAASATAALSYLDFSGIGKRNITAYVERLSASRELATVDLAALLVQTQRADAVAAVIKLAVSPAAYKASASVLRHFSEKGRAQDYRIDPEYAERRRYKLISQPVMLRLLLLEQLRGVRGLQACSVTAMVPQVDDFEIGKVGQYYVGRLPPVCADDEVVLIGELAMGNRRRVFSRNHVTAVKDLGKCRTFIPEAMAVAKTYANRKTPRPRRGRPRRDPLKEAGKQAMAELSRAQARQRKNGTEED